MGRDNGMIMEASTARQQREIMRNQTVYEDISDYAEDLELNRNIQERNVDGFLEDAFMALTQVKGEKAGRALYEAIRCHAAAGAYAHVAYEIRTILEGAGNAEDE